MLLEGELDVTADREPVALLAAAIRGLHDAGATARDDREPLLREQTGRLDGLVVIGVARLRPGGAEDRHRVVNVRKGIEPLHELPHDPEDAPRVGLREGAPLTRQLREETLVLSDDVALRAARALRHGHPARCRGRDIGGEYTVPHVHSTGRCRLPAPGPSCTWASLCGRS